MHPDKHFSPEKFLKKGFSTAKGRRERAHRETFEESVSLMMNLLYEVRNKIQEVQLNNFCCGVESFRDYGDLANFPGDKLPKGVY